MESKINYLWRQFEEGMRAQSHPPSEEALATYKACFYAGAFAATWRIEKHLKARGKDDRWLTEFCTELNDAIHNQAAAEFEGQVQ